MTSTLLEWIRGLSWSDAEVRGAVLAIVATVALIVALKLLARVFARLRKRIRARIEARRITLRLQRWEMVSADAAQRGLRYVLGFFHLVAAVLLIDAYITLLLGLFPATEGLAGDWFDFVVAPIVALYRAVVAYLPNLLYIVAISAATLFALKFLHLFFRAIEAGAVKLPGFYPDWADPTYKIIRALAMVFLLIAIFPRLPGADEQAFKAVSLFVGALLTLGSTAAMGNAVAGVVLTYTRAFQVGDWIRVGAASGEVEERNLLVTRLRNAVNEQVTIPNNEVLRDHVVNYTPAARQGRLGLAIDVGIGYDVPWRTVEELLLEAARATPEISTDPAPRVFQTSLDNFAVSYRLWACTSGPPPLARIRTALGRNILDAFDRAGVEILTPAVSELRGGELLVGEHRGEPDLQSGEERRDEDPVPGE